MRKASYELSGYISDKLQISNIKPNIAVYVRQRYWDHRNLWDQSGIDDAQEWYQLTHRVISIEVSESVDQFASSFNILFENIEGDLAPDNYGGKWPNSIKFEGGGQVTYARQFFPNNEIKIYLGYGEELLPFIHGYVNDAKMSGEGDTLSVSCMTAYKHVIHQTVKEKEIKAPDGNLFDVLKFFFARAGVVLKGSKAIIPGTTVEWDIKNASAKHGQSFDEVIKPLVDTTFFYIKSNFDGSCSFLPIPKYGRDDPGDFIFDQYVNLTSLDYTITDQDVYSAVTVKSGLARNTFYNDFLLNTVTLKKWREDQLDVPWADTYRKRQEVALAHHTSNLHKWRTMNIGVMGDPRIELWDRVGVREQSSSQLWVFHVKAMQTMISDQGFVQVLDMSVNYGFDPLPLDDVEPIQVFMDTIRLKVWDFDAEDGDEINIFCNNKVVEAAYKLKNKPTFVDISLDLGVNQIIIEGHKTPKGGVSGKLEVLDTNNKVLYPVGSLADINFPRINVNKKHYYTKRPAAAWYITRL